MFESLKDALGGDIFYNDGLELPQADWIPPIALNTVDFHKLSEM